MFLQVVYLLGSREQNWKRLKQSTLTFDDEYMRIAVGYMSDTLHFSIKFVHVTETRMDIVTLDSPVHAKWYIL